MKCKFSGIGALQVLPRGEQILFYYEDLEDQRLLLPGEQKLSAESYLKAPLFKLNKTDRPRQSP